MISFIVKLNTLQLSHSGNNDEEK